MRKDNLIVTRVDDDLYEKIENAAEKDNMTKSTWVRRVLANYFLAIPARGTNSAD